MAKSQSLVMAVRNCDNSVQILLCCAMTFSLLSFHLLSACFLIGYCFVSHDNLQIKPAFVLRVPPTHVEYLRSEILMCGGNPEDKHTFDLQMITGNETISNQRSGRFRRSSKHIQSLLTHLTPQENLIR